MNKLGSRIKLIALLVVGFVVVYFALQAYTAENYTEQDYPFFSGKYAPESLQPVDSLTVVTYNIWFGEDISQALSELREIGSQSPLDIILLQEMDEDGTEKLARELALNYVYFPAAIEPTYHHNFGNAILSRWPLVDPHKLILPHRSLSNRMNRTATRATIQIDGAGILVYSVHTESIFTLPQFRAEQYTSILRDIDPTAEFVIIGGDFNTFTQTAVNKIENSYQQASLSRVSADIGYTVDKYGIQLTPDHIFTKGLVGEETGKLTSATASDHLPMWVTVRIK